MDSPAPASTRRIGPAFRTRTLAWMMLVVTATASAMLVFRATAATPEPPFLLPDAPAYAPPDSLSFLALGDTGHANRGQHRVAHAMSALTRYESIDLVMLLGDNIYYDGVRANDDPLWTGAFDEVYNLPGLAVPFFAVLGNHDHHGSVEAQIEHSRINPRWHMPAPYFDWTVTLDAEHDVQFIALDTDPLAGRQGSDPDQLDWLDQTLTQSKATWKIALGHHPVLGADDNRPHLRELRELLTRHHVAAYFCGHDHQLSYIRPEQGPVQVTSGAGSDTRSLEHTRDAAFAHEGLGFACVRLTPGQMLLSFVDARGHVLYTDTLSPPRDAPQAITPRPTPG